MPAYTPPGGSSTELQARNSVGLFQGITGSSFAAGLVTLPQTKVNAQAAIGADSSITVNPLGWSASASTHSTLFVVDSYTSQSVGTQGIYSHVELDPAADTAASIYYGALWASLKTKVGNTRVITDTVSGAVGEVYHQGSGVMEYGIGGTLQAFALSGSPATRLSAARLQVNGGNNQRVIDSSSVKTSSFGGTPTAGFCDGISVAITNTWGVTSGTDTSTGFASTITHNNVTNSTVTTRGYYSRITSATVSGGSSTAVDYFAEFRTTDGDHGYHLWFNSDPVLNYSTAGKLSQHNPGFTKFVAGASNYERIAQHWSSNVAQIGTEAGGTGTLRNVRLTGAEHAVGADASFKEGVFAGFDQKNQLVVKKNVAVYDLAPALFSYAALSAVTEVDASVSAANGEGCYGATIRGDVKSGNAQNHSGVGGWLTYSYHNGSGTVDSLIGGSLVARNNSSGTVTDLRGFSTTVVGGTVASGATTPASYGMHVTAIGGNSVTGIFTAPSKTTTATGATTAGNVRGFHSSLNNTTVISSGTDETIGVDSVMFREGAVGGTINTFGFRSSIRNDAGGSTKFTVDFMGVEPTSLVSDFTNRYQMWLANPGVIAIPYFSTGSEIWHFNPSFTTYVAGAANYERIVQQWSSNVAQIGTEAGGTGTLHPLQLLGSHVRIGGSTAAGELRILEPSGSGTNYVSLISPARAADLKLTLPSGLPTVNQVLEATSVSGSDVTLGWATAGSGSVATDAIWDVKGDLAVGTGANTASRLAVGANGTILSADSAEATGLKWISAPGGGDALVANPLSQFAATTSAQLAGVISDETGSGALMFGTSPVVTTDITIPNTGLHLLDTNGSHDLIVAPGSDLTADRTLTITTGDADRTLTINASTTLGGGTHSGTNTGDQTITLTSDVTGSGTGSFATTISAGAVTLAKMANLAQDQFIGRVTASTGVPETATITAAARTVLDDASVSAMVDTLGGAASNGSGGLVRTTSATLVSPALGTPTSGTLTNCTGLPISSGVSGLGTNVGTFLGTPSSANLAACVTDETGSGALVFATSPTFAGRIKTVATYQDWVDDTDGATITFDLAAGNMHRVTLGGNRTLALSNATAGAQAFTLRLLQDGTGSRTVTWFSTIKWAGGSAPTLTTTASKADVFGFIRTGTDTYDGFVVGQNL